LTHWDSQTRQSIAILSDEIDAQLAIDVWEAALAAPWDGPRPRLGTLESPHHARSRPP
jgi:hypothetical protein